ncbi:MAG: hypothetical protein OER86_02475 [Phycisphaerae bacterium]|nr:hypothetical protein [Phycisphaerae bacterium]
MSDDRIYVRDFGPIPPVFHEFLEDRPFLKCLVCTQDLLDDGTLYSVQKSYVGEEVVLQYAICMSCQVEQVDKELSKESAEAIHRYFSEQVDFETRNHELLGAETVTVDPWIDRCLMCGLERAEARGYTLVAVCDGPDILYHNVPLMICSRCEGAFVKLLSKKTREMLDDFTETYFDCPPSMEDLPFFGKPVLI